MKKLLLTGIAAAMFSIAAIGQERGSEERNEFRQETEQAEENIQEESNEFRRDVEETGEDIEEGAERTADDIEEGAERVGDDIEQGAEDVEQGAERTGEQIEESAEETGEEMDQATEQTLDEMNEDFESTVEDDDQQGNAAFNAAPELEVVEGKEGPNNEVVYQYQNEYFYVDRENKKLVKAEASELQDAEHDVIVKDAQEGSDTNTSGSNRNRDQE
jgi:hypothetical protein